MNQLSICFDCRMKTFDFLPLRFSNDTVTISYLKSTFKGIRKHCSSGSGQIAVFKMKGDNESVHIM